MHSEEKFFSLKYDISKVSLILKFFFFMKYRFFAKRVQSLHVNHGECLLNFISFSLGVGYIFRIVNLYFVCLFVLFIFFLLLPGYRLGSD